MTKLITLSNETLLEQIIEDYSRDVLRCAYLYLNDKHLTLHNEQANRDVTYNEAFFSGFTDPVIRGSAKEIANALASANSQTMVWEQDGRRVFRGGADPRIFNLDYKGIDYAKLIKFAPFPETTPFDCESWFPQESLDELSLYYGQGRLTSATFRSGYNSTALTIAEEWDPDIQTPLDALVVSRFNYSTDHFKQVVQSKDGVPYLITILADDGGELPQVKISSAVLLDGGSFRHYSLILPEAQLPGGSVEAFIKSSFQQ